MCIMIFILIIYFFIDGQPGPNPCNPQPGAGRAAGAAGAACGEGPAGGQQQTEEQKAAQREYLQHVGAQVSTLLEPFGIDVDVEVEEREQGIRHRGHGRGQFRGQGRFSVGVLLCLICVHLVPCNQSCFCPLFIILPLINWVNY